VEIAQKKKSLFLQTQLYYRDNWRPRLDQEIKQANVPDSFPSSFWGRYTSMDHIFNEFDPPFPVKRSEIKYTADYLDGVILPLILEPFHSSFEILKIEIAKQIVEEAFMMLRTQIVAACKEQAVISTWLENKQVVKDQIQLWLSLGASTEIINIPISQSFQMTVKQTSIYKEPPFPVDQNSSYSAECLRESIVPAIFREIVEDKKSIENLILDIDLSAIKEVVNRLAISKDWNRFVLGKRVSGFQEIVEGRKKYAPTERALNLMEKDLTKGLGFPF
jgi:hypothetical protein